MMIVAKKQDRQRVVDILSESFKENKSINYIIKKNKTDRRIKSLMEYAFQVCFLYGKVFLSENGSGCALVLLPDKKKNNLQSMLLDLKLITRCVGIRNIKKVLYREKKIRTLQAEDKEKIYYLWFIGVSTAQQNKGVGSSLLRDIIEDGKRMRRTIFLETSTSRNVPWYEKNGFVQYADLDFGYKLYLLKNQ